MAAVRNQIQQGLKLSKAERRMLRKQNKALHTLKSKAREVGEISDNPTPYVLVKNGGLMCGVKRQDLFNLFHKYGILEDLVMLPGKSYCYACFLSTECATNVVDSLNGQRIAEKSYETSLSNRTLYLAYLAKKPFLTSCSLDASYPPGMVLVKDFINESEENNLFESFSSCKETNGVGQLANETSAEKQLRHRYVKHYGYEFMYGSNTIDKDSPLCDGIPHECWPVVEKIMSLGCVEHWPDQLTINEYLPGQGIPPHIDTHSAFEDGIVSLSLGATVAMEFRHPDGRHVSVLLPRRSILVMTDESRYLWTHGITPRKYDVVNERNVPLHDDESGTDAPRASHAQTGSPGVTILPRQTRLSLTFRKVRNAPCDCQYATYCDSQTGSADVPSKPGDTPDVRDPCPSVPQSDNDAIDLETKHVHNVYEDIAEHFSGTRHSPWPKIAHFLKCLPPGSLVADVGCGNGKYLGINDRLFMSGSDRSPNLAFICRQRGFQVVVCDILSLPYRSGAFDVCICIAVIHHLSTQARRLAALRELVRIIRPGGRILISVWALEQNLDKANPGEVDQKVPENPCDSGVSIETPDMLTPVTNPNPNSNPDPNPEPNPKLNASPNLKPNLKPNPNLNPTIATDITSEINHTCTRSLNLANMAPVYTHDSTSDLLPKLKINTSRSSFEQQDLLVPWHFRGGKKSSKIDNESFCHGEEAQWSSSKKQRVFQRFYHVYKENELVQDCKKLNNITVVRSYYDKGNWCVELQKLGDNE